MAYPLLWPQTQVMDTVGGGTAVGSEQRAEASHLTPGQTGWPCWEGALLGSWPLCFDFKGLWGLGQQDGEAPLVPAVFFFMIIILLVAQGCFLLH